MDKKTDVRDPDEKVVEIEMERLRAFPNHPFKVIGDSQMIELQDSIKKYGVLNPLIVRPKIEGYYEIISGHRRKYAAEKLGYKKIPVIIRMLQDDEAVVIMVDSNLQREQITPSEKAYAYKMKYDAIKKKAGRKNCSQVDHNTAFLHYFNPRSREGSDTNSVTFSLSFLISIHAPAKGATNSCAQQRLVILFQSTLPRRERPGRYSSNFNFRNFNPRSREGSDEVC